eukprot:468525_1
MDLSEVVQSQILSSFCDGKSVSTYFHVLLGNTSLRQFAFDILRDALVDRFKRLALGSHAKSSEEAKDVLDIIREEIRTCVIKRSTDGRWIINNSEYRESGITKYSQWCAIVDYFENMQLGRQRAEYIVWCGGLNAQGLRIERACVSTPYWTVTAMDYLYDELELNSNNYLTHPATFHNLPPSFREAPYGKLHINSERDTDYWNRVCYSLSEDPSSTRHVLVPSQMEYEPQLGFSLSLADPKALHCYWDGDDGGDLEYSLSRFGENATRIMTRLRNV